MHRILGVLALIAFIIEEIFHQRLTRKDKLPAEPTEVEHPGDTLDRFDILRLVELLILALIVSTVAGRPGQTPGQISIILTGLQTARLFGRRILSRWSVLGVLQALEVFLLIILAAVPFFPHSTLRLIVSPASVSALAGTVIYSILMILCTAFTIAYWIKLFSREFSSTYEKFPPLADSEGWAFKFASKAILPGAVAVAGLFIYNGVSAALVLMSLSLIFCSAGLIAVVKENYSGHHPRSHIFWSLSFICIITMLIAGAVNPIGFY